MCRPARPAGMSGRRGLQHVQAGSPSFDWSTPWEPSKGCSCNQSQMDLLPLGNADIRGRLECRAVLAIAAGPQGAPVPLKPPGERKPCQGGCCGGEGQAAGGRPLDVSAFLTRPGRRLPVPHLCEKPPSWVLGGHHPDGSGLQQQVSCTRHMLVTLLVTRISKSLQSCDANQCPECWSPGCVWWDLGLMNGWLPMTVVVAVAGIKPSRR